MFRFDQTADLKPRKPPPSECEHLHAVELASYRKAGNIGGNSI